MKDDTASAGSAPAASPEPAPDARTEGASHRYERDIDLESDSTHARVVRLVGEGKRVLELGPAAGHMTRVLRDRGCTVVGIEADPEMASGAAQFAERIITGDLDQLDLDTELGSDRFDVIIAADVLEHLRDPLAALTRLRPFLSEHGGFVISLPNVAHGSVRLALLEGRFAYQDVGLLDRTHLRFFTRASIEELLDAASLGIAELFRQPLDISASEVHFDLDALPPGVLEAIERDPEARTYQFVIRAVPMESAGMREVQRTLARDVVEARERAAELEAEVAQLRLELEGLRAIGRHAAELRAALIEAHDQALQRDEEIQRLHRALAAEGEQALQLRVRLERITGSTPVRAYQTLAQLPGIQTLKARRTARYRRAVEDARRNG